MKNEEVRFSKRHGPSLVVALVIRGRYALVLSVGFEKDA